MVYCINTDCTCYTTTLEKFIATQHCTMHVSLRRLLDRTRRHDADALVTVEAHLKANHHITRPLPASYGGYTYLHLAALHGHNRAAALLVIYGADRDARDDTGHTAFDVSSDSFCTSVVWTSHQLRRHTQFWTMLETVEHPLHVALITNCLNAAHERLTTGAMRLGSCPSYVLQRTLASCLKHQFTDLHSVLCLWTPTAQHTRARGADFVATVRCVLRVALRHSILASTGKTTMQLPLELWFLILRFMPFKI